MYLNDVIKTETSQNYFTRGPTTEANESNEIILLAKCIDLVLVITDRLVSTKKAKDCATLHNRYQSVFAFFSTTSERTITCVNVTLKALQKTTIWPLIKVS